MDYGLTLVTPPVLEPLTLREIKRHLNLADQFVRDDVLIFQQLLPQSRRELEDYCNRALITQSWRLTLDRPPTEVLLPRNPVQSITLVEYENADGDLVEVPNEQIRLLTDREPAVLHLAYPQPWPSDRGRNLAGIRVDYVAGYGATAAAVPAGIKGCILRLIETYYRFRGQTAPPDTLYWAMDQFRVGDEFDQYPHGLTAGVSL